MKTINLKDYYLYLQDDCFVEVDDNVAETMRQYELDELAYWRRVYRYKAYYSLDRGDGIEKEALDLPPSACEVCEQNHDMRQLYAALMTLPKKQSGRLYAHFFFNMSKVDIARMEKVSEHSVRVAIERGLSKLKKYLEKNNS